MTYPLIYLEWCDAASYGNGEWLSIQDAVDWAKTDESWLVHEVGFVLKETDEYLLLTNQVVDNSNVGNVMKIPVTWIRKRIDISDAVK